MEQEFYNAIVGGDVSILDKTHYNEDYFLRQTDSLNNNYLHLAIRYRQISFLGVALNSFPGPSNVNDKLLCEKNRDGNSPLHVAVVVGNNEILNLLLEYNRTGPQDGRSKLWRVQNKEGNTPLHLAFMYAKFSLARVLLLEVQDTLQAKDINDSKETLLHLAIKYNGIGDKKELARKAISLLNPNLLASMEGFQQGAHLLPIVELLLQKDSEVADWPDANGLTPLLRAALLKPPHDMEVVKLILDYHPQSAAVCDLSGKTILHSFNRKLSYEEAQELLGYPDTNCLINFRDSNGNTPAHVAVLRNNFNLLRVLLDFSADVSIVNNECVSAADLLEQNTTFQETGISELNSSLCFSIHHAFTEEDLIEVLGGRQVILLSRTPNGRNILHVLLKDIHAKVMFDKGDFIITCVKKIFDKFPNLLWQTDDDGKTPVHCFANSSTDTDEKWKIFVGKLVDTIDECYKSIDCESPWRIKNHKGNTPLHVAIKKNLFTAVQIWKKDMDVVGITNNRQETPLHLLSISDTLDDTYTYFDGPQQMVDYGIRWMITMKRDVDGATSFMRAYKSRLKATISMYDPHFNKVMFDSHPNDGNTMLHLALEEGHFELAQLYIAASCFTSRFITSNPAPYNQDRLLDRPNNKGVTPGDLIGSIEYLPYDFEEFLWKEGILASYRSMYGVPMSKIEAYTNTIGVIAALLATVTFTAAFTVPGGLNPDDGTPLLMRKAAFQVFMVSNLLALCFSVMVLFCLLWVMTTQNRKESISLVDTSILLLQLSFFATLAAFMMGVYVTTITISPWTAILSCVLCCLLILLMHRWFVKNYFGASCTRLIMWSNQIKNALKEKGKSSCKCLEAKDEENPS